MGVAMKPASGQVHLQKKFLVPQASSLRFVGDLPQERKKADCGRREVAGQARLRLLTVKALVLIAVAGDLPGFLQVPEPFLHHRQGQP